VSISINAHVAIVFALAYLIGRVITRYRRR
jgi:hypothetical protein